MAFNKLGSAFAILVFEELGFIIFKSSSSFCELAGLGCSKSLSYSFTLISIEAFLETQ